MTGSTARSRQAGDRSGRRSARKTLSREAWISAAVTSLERKGIANVKIDRLSRQLKVTRGSFYFHFKNLKDLLSSLLDEWRLRNCQPFHGLLDVKVVDGPGFFDAVTGVWIREDPFSPKLDLAIRDWSRSSAAIAREVQAQDDFRIALLVKAFGAMAYDEDESVVRARVTYFQQIGYYATFFKEPPAERKRYRPLYTKVLVGPVERGRRRFSDEPTSRNEMSLPVPYLSARTLTVVKPIDTSGASRIVNLGLNESWLGPAPGVVDAIRNSAQQAYRYADPGCNAMRAAIGNQFGLDPARIVCGNGSEELLDAVGRVYARAGDEILFPAYSFLQFAIVAYRLGARAVEVPLGPDFAVDIDAIVASVTPATRVVYLANPNNPTGVAVPMDEVARLAAELPSRVVLVLDCAYAEYVAPSEAAETFAIADRHPNVIVTRTFSKAYGMASARAGWAYAHPEVIAALNNVRGIGNVNGMAQAAATVAVGEQGFIEHVRNRTAEERGYLEGQLVAFGFETSSSAANFAFARLPGARAGWAQAVVARLARQGFIIRSNEDYGLPDWLRISIGERADLDSVLDLLRVEAASQDAIPTARHASA